MRRLPILSSTLLHADYPRLDTSSYEPILLSLHTNIPYNPASTLSLNLSSTENAVLPYLPPHPAKQNPNLWHRIVVMVCEQTEKIEVAVPAPAAQEVSQRSEWVKDEDGPKEKELKIRERLEMLPFLKLARKHALEPIGFGYWKAEWTPRASAIFTKLGWFATCACELGIDGIIFSVDRTARTGARVVAKGHLGIFPRPFADSL